MRTVEHWKRLTREAVEFPSLEKLKTSLGMTLNN